MKFSITLMLSITLLFTTMQASEISPTKEEVAKLYVATFNRAPDSAGLLWWINESGFTLSHIAKSFFEQTETKALYPDGTTNGAFINSIYANLFNRTPDTAGYNYWKAELDSGIAKRDYFIRMVIEGAKDDANGMDKTILNNKTEVGLYFADAGFGTDDFPTIVMSGVTADSDTVEFIKGVINNGAISENVWDTGKDGDLDLSDASTGTSQYVSFDESFLAMPDESYYALECEDVISTEGEEVAQFNLIPKQFHAMNLPLIIDNNTLTVDAGSIKQVYAVSPEGDSFGGGSTHIVVNTYLNNNLMGFKPELWYYVGAQSPLTGEITRDIDAIAHVWYTYSGGNLWTETKHQIAGKCIESDTFLKALDVIQSELDRRAVGSSEPAYQLGK